MISVYLLVRIHDVDYSKIVQIPALPPIGSNLSLQLIGPARVDSMLWFEDAPTEFTVTISRLDSIPLYPEELMKNGWD